MQDKQIDLSKSLYELSREFPALIAVMVDLGFHDIAKPGMLATAGRFMTIPKGAKLKGIDLDTIRQTLTEQGFHILESGGRSNER